MNGEHGEVLKLTASPTAMVVVSERASKVGSMMAATRERRWARVREIRAMVDQNEESRVPMDMGEYVEAPRGISDGD